MIFLAKGGAGRRSLEVERVSEPKRFLDCMFVKERVRVAAVHLIELGARPLYSSIAQTHPSPKDPWLQYDPGCLCPVYHHQQGEE